MAPWVVGGLPGQKCMGRSPLHLLPFVSHWAMMDNVCGMFDTCHHWTKFEFFVLLKCQPFQRSRWYPTHFTEGKTGSHSCKGHNEDSDPHLSANTTVLITITEHCLSCLTSLNLCFISVLEIIPMDALEESVFLWKLYNLLNITQKLYAIICK